MEMDLTVEVDEQKVIDNLDSEEIFEMSGMDESNCKDQFGDKLLERFTSSEIVEYFGSSVLLNEIGEEEAIKHFGIDVAE